jgi:hypothetical protein
MDIRKYMKKQPEQPALAVFSYIFSNVIVGHCVLPPLEKIPAGAHGIALNCP